MPPHIRKVTELAGNIIEDYILFDNPLPNAEETAVIVNDAWKQAQIELQIGIAKLEAAEQHVCLLSPGRPHMLTHRQSIDSKLHESTTITPHL